jgi:VIT1/CCC1 family predicted Fe2+/Mn2+ transporter
MEGFSSHETKLLVGIINDICLYKMMLSSGYERILDNVSKSRSADLLREIQENEARDVDLWIRHLHELDSKQKLPSRSLNFRVWLMMLILGRRGFLEWALIAEDESVEDLLILATLIEDRVAAEHWIRLADDERKHVRLIKEKLLGMEAWELSEGGGVRDVIFGANDGLVSILALVAGVYGALTDNSIILLTGVAGAIAGTVSMGAGAFISAKSEQEVMRKERRRKGLRGNRDTKKEIQELNAQFLRKGFRDQEAESIAERIVNEMREQDQIALGEVVGVTTADEWPASKTGLLTGLSFLFASLIPLFPFTLLDTTLAAIIAAVASILALFAIGASKALFTRSNWIRSGLEMMGIGSIAALSTYFIGSILGV